MVSLIFLSRLLIFINLDTVVGISIRVFDAKLVRIPDFRRNGDFLVHVLGWVVWCNFGVVQCHRPIVFQSQSWFILLNGLGPSLQAPRTETMVDGYRAYQRGAKHSPLLKFLDQPEAASEGGATYMCFLDIDCQF